MIFSNFNAPPLNKYLPKFSWIAENEFEVFQGAKDFFFWSSGSFVTFSLWWVLGLTEEIF